MWKAAEKGYRKNCKSIRPQPLIGQPGTYMKSRILLLITAVWLGCLFKASAILQLPMTVTNIAELQSLNLASVMGAESAYTNSTSPAVYVLGYYKPGDRGGGMFEWDPNSSVTPDGGRFFTNNGVSGNGRWVRRFAGEIPNVRMWGAMGNIAGGVEGLTQVSNAHDDTTNIQNAINAIALPPDDGNMNPCELYFPAGFYKITDTLVFSQLIKIRGENARMAHIVMPYGINKDILHTIQADWVLKGTNGLGLFDENVRIEDIAFDFALDSSTGSGVGVAENLTNAALVIVQPEEGTTIRNVSFSSGGYGIRCFGGGGGADASFRDIVCQDIAIAGICVEPVPGAGGCGGQVTITGITSDQRRDEARSNACLVKFVDYEGPAYIEGINTEGIYGGGVIQHSFPAGADFYDLGNLTIKNGFLNDGNSYGNLDAPHAFLVLKNSGVRTAAVTMENIHLYNCTNLIRDELSQRDVHGPDATSSGLRQAVVRLPLSYEGYNDGNTASDGFTESRYSRLVIGGQEIYSFVPPTTNAWYRIMTGLGKPFISGEATINSFGESSAFSVSALATADTDNPVELKVTRTMKADSWPYPPCVTKVRAGSYTDSGTGAYAFTDIFVERGISPSGYSDVDGQEITIAVPVYDYPNVSMGLGQPLLLPPKLTTSSGAPAGCTLITCVTNSLVR